MKLTILGTPLAKQSARFRIAKGSGGKQFVHSYQKKEVKDAERNTAFEVKSQLPLGFTPYQDAIAVKVTFVFPPLKGWSKKKMEELESGVVIYKSTKPDLHDNLQKGLFDAMEGIVFINDSQICKVESEKIYGTTPRTEIEIRKIEA